ncbi:MAG: hypothetical protein CMP07_10460 [Xanthomonadales bacterium]|nr:hypothetical protein [Xanthomonadales bacterium]
MMKLNLELFSNLFKTSRPCAINQPVHLLRATGLCRQDFSLRSEFGFRIFPIEFDLQWIGRTGVFRVVGDRPGLNPGLFR